MLRGLNGVHCSWFICRDSFTCIRILHVFEFCIPLSVPTVYCRLLEAGRYRPSCYLERRYC